MILRSLAPFNCKKPKPASHLLARAGPIRSKFLTDPLLVEVVLNIIHVLALIRIPIVFVEEDDVILIIKHLL